MLAVYVLFFISQWKYYLSAFTGKLPVETSYAEYAREGFFQLCAVAVINLLVVIAVSLFMKRKGEKPSVPQRILSVAVSVSTLVLIATALAKMVMYIDCYGLTHKRVYASWFMAVLAALFVIIAVKQFVHRLPVIALSFAMCVISFAFLVFADADTVIAEYNVDRYIEGSLDNVDINNLTDLGDSALPALIRLGKHLDEQLSTDIRDYTDSGDYYIYEDGYNSLQDDVFYSSVVNAVADLKNEHELNFFDFSLPAYRAEKALQYFNEK